MNKPYCLTFLTLTFLFTSCISTQRQNSCSSFKEGKFKLNSHVDNATYIIARHDSVQTETNIKTKQVTVAKITWTSDCEYELLHIIQPTDSINTINKFFESTPAKVKILKATKSYYVFEAYADGVNAKLVDTLWHLKD